MRKLVMLPGPTNVPDRVMRAMMEPIINHRGEEFHSLYAGIQEKIRQVFQTEGEVVVLTSSGTGGVMASVLNLVRPGDVVLVTDFGEFGGRLGDAIEEAGGKAVRIKAGLGEAPSLEQVKEAFDENPNAKALYVVYNETSTGVTVRWLREAGKLAKEHDSFLVVDAISILGGDELPVDRWGIDICVTCTQKCLAAPPGLALLSLSDEASAYIRKNPPKNQYFDLARYLKFYREKRETPFTPSLPLFSALDEALSIVLEEGLERRIRRHATCARAFYSALEEMGFEPIAKQEVRSNTVIGLAYPDGMEDRAFRRLLADKFHVLVAGGFGSLAGRAFRIGCMGEVSSYHVLTTISAIGGALSFLGRPSSLSEALKTAEGLLKDLEPLEANERA